MFAHERQHRIVALLETQQRLGLDELRRAFGVSAATLRRDLTHLQRIGKLVRTHGGVTHASLGAGEPAFERKVRTAAGAKAKIAVAAGQLVPANATLFLDAGTTTLELGRRLLARDDLTIFTNSLPVLNERRAGRSSLIAIGGELREISRAFVGSLAMDWLKHLRFDYTFVGASGLDAGDGASTTELMEAAIKKEAIARARRVVLLADASKWDKAAPIRFGAWKEFSDLVTDGSPARRDREALRRAGVELHVAD